MTVQTKEQQPGQTRVRTQRRRPPGRNVLQEQQRQETRAKLIDAARAVFSETGYVDTRIEDVLTRAGVSRASFYAHFENKLALVRAIAEDFSPVWGRLYDELAAMKAPTLADLEDWMARHVDIYRENEATTILLTETVALEKSLYWQFCEMQEALIERLGQSIPAFRLACEDSLDGQQARVHAMLLLSQLDHACYFLAVRRSAIDPMLGVRVMAKQLQAFLALGD